MSKDLEKLSDDHENVLAFVTGRVYAKAMNIKVINFSDLRPGMHLAGSSSRVKSVKHFDDGTTLVYFVDEWAQPLFWQGPTIAVVED